MLLRSIKLENFRQFVNESIEFSTDENQNVTLIIGDNGTGKTTFTQAFFWCLYGETSFTDKNLLNRKISEEMTPDQKVTVKVVLKLTHGSADYEIVRTQEYKKSYSNKISAANTVLNVSVKLADGNTRYLKALECESEIKKILPKELSNYFFFDGERIEKMGKEIASGKKSNSFATAVVGLTGLNGTLAALDHLSPSKPASSVIGRITSGYIGDSAGKIKQLTEDIDKLQEKLNGIESRLGEIEGEIDAAETTRAQCETDIRQFDESAKLQGDRERLEKEVAAAEKVQQQLVKSLCADFNDDMTAFFAKSMVKRALEVASTGDIVGKDIPNMHSNTIDYLVRRGSCLCGTQLMEGSLAYKNLMDLRNFLPPHSIGVVVGGFIKDSRNLYQDNNDLLQRVTDVMSTISLQQDSIADKTEEINRITILLDGNDVSEKVRLLNSQISECKKIVRERKEEQRQLFIQQGSFGESKKRKEVERAELALADKRNRLIERCKAYALRIYTDLKAEYDVREAEIRKELESSINEIFKTIYNGGLSLSIDEKYNISVFVNEIDGVETSTAQSIAVIFAFISAIIKMARENRTKNDSEAFSEPYPLVMDAPLSAFDKRRIRAICEAIPETAEQVIVFIKDTDGELAEEYLGNKVKARHRFIKIDEFNTRME